MVEVWKGRAAVGASAPLRRLSAAGGARLAAPVSVAEGREPAGRAPTWAPAGGRRSRRPSPGLSATAEERGRGVQTGAALGRASCELRPRRASLPGTCRRFSSKNRSLTGELAVRRFLGLAAAVPVSCPNAGGTWLCYLERFSEDAGLAAASKDGNSL